MPKILGLFDRAYLIHRDQDTDRFMRSARRLLDVGIAFERFSAICFDQAGHFESAGCRGNIASHLAIIQKARDEGLDNVLIMQGDVIFRDDFNIRWVQIALNLESLNYDIFFGYSWWNQRGNPKSLTSRRITDTVCTHFWVIKAHYFETFIASVHSNIEKEKPAAIDGIFNSQNAVIHAPTYNLVGQDEGISLVNEGALKKLRWHADRHREKWIPE